MKKLENRPVFLLDSVDFPVKGFHGMKKKNKMWSKKLEKPGRRYQVVSDGSGIPLKIFGGYSPKTYDAHWVEHNRDWLDNNLENAISLGDCHYWSGQDECHRMELIASMPKTVKPHNGIVYVGCKSIDVTTEEFQLRQKFIQNVRANVERPFGQMKLTFKVLTKKFMDGPSQLDCLVRFSAAVLLHKSKFYYSQY